MRTLVIGDIHGCYAALDALLEAARPGPDDRLITLGDYVDRGPDSRLVLDRLIGLYEAGRLVPLRGNHDEMMVESQRDLGARRMWLRFGGLQTLQSYDHWPQDAVYDRVPERHWQFLIDDCRDYFETDTHLYVHAMADPDLPLAEQSTEVLLWERLGGRVEHASGKVLVCGHTLQDGGVPLDLGTTICIDTGIYLPGGWLTCLHVEAGYYWQANQQGQTREGTLEELYRLAGRE